MKTRPILALLAFCAAFAPLASAHPGHGDHDFTWDFRHLVEHPVATIAWLGIFAGATWAVARLVRASRTARPRR
jgi:hydrogenase/urease accessory protein HupE